MDYEDFEKENGMEELLDMLRSCGPRRAPDTLRKGVMTEVKPSKKISFMKKHKNSITRIAALVAVGVVAAFVITAKMTSFNNLRAAEQMVTKAKESLTDVKTVVIEMDVRNRLSGDDPHHIYPSSPMKAWTVNIENGDPTRALMRKGKHTFYNEDGVIILLSDGEIDMIKVGDDKNDWTAGWFVNVTVPSQLYENLSKVPANNKRESTSDDGVNVEVTAVAGDGTPFGDFAQIDGQKVISRFTFDKESYLLKSFTVELEQGNGTLKEIVKSKSIKYNVPVDMGESEVWKKEFLNRFK